MKTLNHYHIVKGEDLNHHGTLFAGRCCEWVVEAGLIAASDMTNPENVVCVNIHNLHFSSPVDKGEIIRIESKVVLVGKTKIVAHIGVNKADGSTMLEGFITYVHVDDKGKPKPHKLKEITAADEKEGELIRRAKELHQSR